MDKFLIVTDNDGVIYADAKHYGFGYYDFGNFSYGDCDYGGRGTDYAIACDNE